MRKPCILLAEDNADQRELFIYLLEIEGFEVRSVTNGKEALAELQRGPLDCNPPDLILTDIAMPEMSGLDLVKAVREKEEYSHVPIVVMTNFEKGYLTWAWAAGANGTLAKPFSAEDLHAVILNVLPTSREH